MASDIPPNTQTARNSHNSALLTRDEPVGQRWGLDFVLGEGETDGERRRPCPMMGDCLVNAGNHKFENGTVLASGDAFVNLSGNAIAYVQGRAQVHTKTSQCVMAYDRTRVLVEGTAMVSAFDEAHIEAAGCAHVNVLDNATVNASENARVHAYGDSSVFATDNVRVDAHARARVTAFDNTVIRVHSSNVEITASGSATIIRVGNCRPRITVVMPCGGVTVQ